MRTGVGQAEDGAPEKTRRVVRLLVLLGVVVAAYLVLSLFDHAARADAGSIDQPMNHIGAPDAVDSVKATAAGVRKTIPAPRSTTPKSTTPKSTTPKAHPPTIHRSTIKMPQVRPSKVQAPKNLHAPKRIKASKRIPTPSVRAGETARRVQVRTSKLRQPTSDAVRDTARATEPSARTAVVRQKSSALAQLPSLRKLASLPQAKLAALPQ